MRAATPSAVDSLPIRVTLEEWTILQDAFARVFHALPGVKVLAFGSRSQHHTGPVVKPYSDLDLIVESSEPLPAGALAQLRDILTESDLPWKVDVLDAREVSLAFRRIIDSSCIQLFES